MGLIVLFIFIIVSYKLPFAVWIYSISFKIISCFHLVNAWDSWLPSQGLSLFLRQQSRSLIINECSRLFEKQRLSDWRSLKKACLPLRFRTLHSPIFYYQYNITLALLSWLRPLLECPTLNFLFGCTRLPFHALIEGLVRFGSRILRLHMGKRDVSSSSMLICRSNLWCLVLMSWTIPRMNLVACWRYSLSIKNWLH